jgi:hypothetical protein
VPIKLITGGDWNTYAATYNTRLQYTPAVIALPTTNQNVQDAVTCGVQFGAKMQAKGGGHSYASFSTGGMNGDLMIDMQQFQTVTVDGSGVATVGAGLRCVISFRTIFIPRSTVFRPVPCVKSLIARQYRGCIKLQRRSASRRQLAEHCCILIQL